MFGFCAYERAPHFSAPIDRHLTTMPKTSSSTKTTTHLKKVKKADADAATGKHRRMKRGARNVRAIPRSQRTTRSSINAKAPTTRAIHHALERAVLLHTKSTGRSFNTRKDYVAGSKTKPASMTVGAQEAIARATEKIVVDIAKKAMQSASDGGNTTLSLLRVYSALESDKRYMAIIDEGDFTQVMQAARADAGLSEKKMGSVDLAERLLSLRTRSAARLDAEIAQSAV